MHEAHNEAVQGACRSRTGGTFRPSRGLFPANPNVLLHAKALQLTAKGVYDRSVDPLGGARGAGVYFLSDGRGRVKIGYASDLAHRFAAIQTGSADALTLIGWCPGGRAVEREWHERFGDARIRGEWFTLTPELAKAIPAVPRLPSAALRLIERADALIDKERVAAIALYELALLEVAA
jgi:hypothetical protein